jgi:hypothetical protein
MQDLCLLLLSRVQSDLSSHAASYIHKTIWKIPVPTMQRRRAHLA